MGGWGHIEWTGGNNIYDSFREPAKIKVNCDGTVSIITLFIGRAHILKYYLRSLENLAFSRKKIHLIWHNTSKIPYFNRLLHNWLSRHGHKYASITYIDCLNSSHKFEEVGKGQDAINAITEGYNHARQYIKGSYVLALEDDILCPPNTLKNLVKLIDSDKKLKAVSVNNLSRLSVDWAPGKSIVWKFIRNSPDTWRAERIDRDGHKGIQYVGAAHLGCTLIDTSWLAKSPFVSEVVNLEGSAGPDVSLGFMIKQKGYKYGLDWDTKVRHYDIDGSYV